MEELLKNILEELYKANDKLEDIKNGISFIEVDTSSISDVEYNTRLTNDTCVEILQFLEDKE